MASKFLYISKNTIKYFSTITYKEQLFTMAQTNNYELCEEYLKKYIEDIKKRNRSISNEINNASWDLSNNTNSIQSN